MRPWLLSLLLLGLGVLLAKSYTAILLTWKAGCRPDVVASQWVMRCPVPRW